ncbi:unnamed protein product [Rhizoctonia solani]|uniref:Uncharacterized protein n=1 Tax=Rhizoctonia solani TaxID=456999 RepID=A0A8H3BQX2_9AGAM|nr:unnamed protein product [Rhizoctonia solani]
MSTIPRSLLASSANAKHFLDRAVEALGFLKRESRIQIAFPDGWKDLSSDPGTVGEWYRLQGGCTRFQTVLYCKFKTGVQHEYILLPLFERPDQPTQWFCKIERMADPRFKDRINAIGIHGTDAFDYVQVFDRASNEYQDLKENCFIVADIHYPRTLDLYHALAICWAIGSNPKTQRYTLQQFNCYFFSWTIVLCLARYATGWEVTYRSCIEEIKEEILNSVESSDSTTQAKLLLILSKIRRSGSEESQDQHSLLSTLGVELGGEGFTSAMGKSISSMLWEENGPDFIRTALRGRLKVLADNTVDLLAEGLGIDNELPLIYQRKEAGPRSIHRYSLEAAKIFHRDAWRQAPGHVKELERGIKNERGSTEDVGAHKSLAHRIGASRGVVLAIMPAFITQYGYQGAYLAARADDRLWRHDGRDRTLRKILFVGNTIRHLPRHVYYATKIALPYTSIVTSKVKELDTTFFEIGQAGVARMVSELHHGIQDKYGPHTLQDTIVELREKNPEWDEQMIRQVIVEIIFELANEIGAVEMSPKEIWDVMLWQCLGEIITDVVLKVIKRHLLNIGFKWRQNTSLDSINQPSEPATKSHQELQTFMRQRIERLSKRQIETMRIVEHIPAPFATPAPQSQKEMEDQIEAIWRGSIPILEDHQSFS